MSNKNYYEEKLALIKELITNKEYEKALQEIIIELNMPYIPAIYEPEFKNLHEVIKSNLNTSSDRVSTLTREEIIDLLLSDDDEHQAIALELLPEQNLRNSKIELKQRIETWEEKDNIKKAFLFELMIEQQIDINIQYDNVNLLNPSKIQTVIENKEVQKMILKIHELTEKDPTIAVAAQGESRRFLLLKYPWIPLNGELFGTQIVNVVKYMFGLEVDLNPEETNIYKELKK